MHDGLVRLVSVADSVLVVLLMLKVVVTVQVPSVKVAVWYPAINPVYVCGEVCDDPPSKLILPATLPVRVTAPVEAPQVVLVMALAVRVKAVGLVKTTAEANTALQPLASVTVTV